MTAVPEGEYDDVNNQNNDQNDSNTCDGTSAESELTQFLSKHDLMDIHLQILSSKLSLRHLIKADKNDLNDLCADLKLNSSQKIRLKHAIKSLQKRKICKKRIKHKIRVKAKVKKQPQNVANQYKLKSKLVIVGQAAVGKTTLQKAMMGYEFEPGSKATYAVNSSHYKQEYDHNDVRLSVDYQIFDTPGLDRFSDIISLYLRGALAVMVVYDVCNSESFEKAKWWIEYLEDNASGYDKIMLIANKIDIHCNNDDDDEKSTDDGKECVIKQGRLYATKRGISFLEISAKNKENINVLLGWINKQNKMKIDKNPSLIEANKQSVQLHESLINGKVMKSNKKWMDEVSYSKCCSF